jgi:hypothetical protein
LGLRILGFNLYKPWADPEPSRRIDLPGPLIKNIAFKSSSKGHLETLGSQTFQDDLLGSFT